MSYSFIYICGSIEIVRVYVHILFAIRCLLFPTLSSVFIGFSLSLVFDVSQCSTPCYLVRNRFGLAI